METRESLSQAAEDVRLLQLFPDGVVPEWNAALCKMMLSEGAIPEDGESYLRLQRVVVSYDGHSWDAFEGAISGGAYALHQWITQDSADDAFEAYEEWSKRRSSKLARRVADAFHRACGSRQGFTTVDEKEVRP